VRRIVALVVVGVLAWLAVSAVPPRPSGAPDFGAPPSGDAGEAVGRTSAWYCPWVDAGAVRDAVLGLVSEVPVEATITLPSPIPNEAPDLLPVTLRRPDARDVSIASIVRRGEAPAIVEFDDGPAGVGSLMWSDAILTADRCTTTVSKEWHMTGGTTATDHATQLRLFNPFPEPAKVDVTALSEFGSEPLPEFQAVDVLPRSWTTLDLTVPLPLRDVLSVIVTATQGLVVPTLVVENDTDEASWPGTRTAATWEFPLVADGGLEPYLTLSNATDGTVTAAIDVFGPDGPITGETNVELAPRTPVTVPLAEIAVPPFGIRVRASAAIAATVTARPPAAAGPGGEGETSPPTTGAAGDGGDTTLPPDAGQSPPSPTVEGLAGTIGVAEPAARWLVASTGSLEDAAATIWLLNTGDAPVTVTLDPVGPGDPPPQKVVVGAGSVLPVTADSSEDVDGYLVAATGPISVATSIVDARGVAFTSAIPVR